MLGPHKIYRLGKHFYWMGGEVQTKCSLLHPKTLLYLRIFWIRLHFVCLGLVLRLYEYFRRNMLWTIKGKEFKMYGYWQHIGIFLCSGISKTALWPTQVHIQMSPRISTELSSRGVNVTTHLPSRLRMGGDTPPLPLHAFMTWKGIHLCTNLTTCALGLRIILKRFSQGNGCSGRHYTSTAVVHSQYPNKLCLYYLR